jgi:Fe-S-cluster containining protein
MGKLSRRVSRQERFKLTARQDPTTRSYDYDLTKTQMTDIVSVKLDSAENQVSIELNLPVHGGVSYAGYEEVIDFDEQNIPGYLLDAARRMYEAAARAIRERVYTDREVPCATCTGNCCGRAFSAVRLTHDDITRLAEVVKIEEQVQMYDEISFSGYVGEFNLVPYYGDEDQMMCPNLTPEGCGIYENRPLICREYSPWDCDIYEADPEKVDGKVKHKLKVVE